MNFYQLKEKIIRLDIIEYICEYLNMKIKILFNDEVFDNIKIQS
jgi:DNA-binding Xre family transcriptional regulator